MLSTRTCDWHGFLGAQIWNQIMSKEQYFNVDWCCWQGDMSDFPASEILRFWEGWSQRVSHHPAITCACLLLDHQPFDHLRLQYQPAHVVHWNLPSTSLSMLVFNPCPAVLHLFLCLSVCLVRLSWLYLPGCLPVTPGVVQLSTGAPIFPIWGWPDIYFTSSPISLLVCQTFGLFSILPPLVCIRGRNAKEDSDDRICSDEDCRRRWWFIFCSK